jgi:hypothetical protein
LLWGFLKDDVHKNNSHIFEELKEKFIAAINSFSEKISAANMKNISPC